MSAVAGVSDSVPGIFDSTAARALRFGLAGLAQRSQVISTNVANVDTPGYTARTVDFESVLRQAVADAQPPTGIMMTVTNPAHIRPTTQLTTAQPIEGIDVTSASRNDGNNVDMDKEMTSLAQTNIMYDALTELESLQLAQTKLAVREGR